MDTKTEELVGVLQLEINWLMIGKRISEEIAAENLGIDIPDARGLLRITSETTIAELAQIAQGLKADWVMSLNPVYKKPWEDE